MTRSRLYSSRLFERFLWHFLFFTLVAGRVFASGPSSPAMTVITDTIFRADGTPAQGTLLATWPAFTTADNRTVAAGSKSITIGASGAVQLSLIPNEGAVPAGTYYKIVLKLDDGTTSTEYWVVQAASPVTISAIRSNLTSAAEKGIGRLVVPDPVSATDAANKRYVDASSGGAKYADRFTGATPEEQINAASAALGGNIGLVWVPSTMSGSYSQSTPLASKSLVADFRGCYFNVYASEADCNSSNIKGGAFWRQTIAEPAATSAKTYTSFQIFQDVASGGINQGTPTNIKSNFDSFLVSQRAATPGQHQALTSVIMNGSNGDTFAGAFQSYQYGNTNAAGDEGMKALSAYAYQGSEEFGALVSSVVGNVIKYTSANYEYSRGEKRYLINMSRGVYSTGTVSNIAGSPPAVTGSDTSWASLCPGGSAPCTPSNLYFSLDGGNAAGPQMFVLRVAQVISNTQLSLTFDTDTSGSWTGDAISGTYKIYKGSTVTAVGKAGNVTVADGAQFQAGDWLKMPLGNNLGLVAAAFQCAKYVPGGWLSSCAYVQNSVGTRYLDSGLSVTGKFGNMLSLSPDAAGGAGNLIKSNGAFGEAMLLYGTPANAVVGLFSVNHNDGWQAHFQYDKQSGRWQTTHGGFGIFGELTGTLLTASTRDGVDRFRVTDTAVDFNNGVSLSGHPGNYDTAKWTINGATGAASFGALTVSSCTGCGGSGSSPLTTKGDLYGYSTVGARIPVGNDGSCLIADSTQALGLRWGTCSAASSTYSNLFQPDANTLDQRNGTNPQVRRMYSSYTDSANWEALKVSYGGGWWAIDATDRAGSGSSRSLQFNSTGSYYFKIGGVSYLQVDNGGVYPTTSNQIPLGKPSNRYTVGYFSQNVITPAVTLDSTASPICDATHRGQFTYTAGAAGVKDTVQVCVKNASDAYQWAVLY